MLKNKLKRLLAVAVWAVMMCGVLGLSPVGTIQLLEPIEAKASTNGHTVDEAMAWCESKLGQSLYNGECVGLIVEYYKYLGQAMVYGNAKDYATNSLPAGWQRIAGATPQRGDILVYTGGQWGHVAICESANVHYDQNVTGMNDGYGVRTVHKCYWSCISSDYWGVIRPDFADPTPTGHVMSESEGAGQTIPDGVYHIMSGVNQNYGLADGGRQVTPNGTNVFLNNWGQSVYGENLENIGKTDTWKVTYLNNGFYRIQQNGAKVSLDVDGASLKRGTNVHAWEDNDSAAQQWSIVPKEHGYALQSRANGYVLDVDGGVVENGRNVQVWEVNDSNAQMWCFIPYNPEPIVEDGLYRIHSAVDESFVLDIQGYADLGYAEGAKTQIFDSTCDNVYQITHDSNGYYYIEDPSTGMVIGRKPTVDYYICDSDMALYRKANERSKKWVISPKSEDTYCIISMLNGRVFDLAISSLDTKIENRINVYLHDYHGLANQQWSLEKITPQSLTIEHLPNKTTYFTEDTLDSTGIKVMVNYTNGESYPIGNATYDYDFSTSGEKVVTVKCEIGGQMLTDTFDVMVESIEFKGSGTESDPYLIESKADLEKLRDLVNSEDYAPAFKSCYYLQTVDIDLNDEKWTPIGKAWANGEQTASLRFEGHYDGGQHWIYGLNVNEETKFAGLFGKVNSGTVENLAVEGVVSGDDISVGGIVGEINGATISGCCFIGDVTGGSTAAGGIVGYMWQSGTVQNCYHIGSVKTSDTHSAGGVVGRIQSNEIKSAVCAVENCYHVGKMDSSQKNYGTIVGYIDKVETDVGQRIELVNCYGINTDGGLYAGDKPDTDTAQAVKESVLKLMAPTLGDAYVKNTDSNYLDGYPVFPWQTRLVGDVNVDGTFNISDAVLLQKWLLAVPDTHLANWKAADMCEDNKLDVFDLCMMKSKLING